MSKPFQVRIRHLTDPKATISIGEPDGTGGFMIPFDRLADVTGHGFAICHKDSDWSPSSDPSPAPPAPGPEEPAQPPTQVAESPPEPPPGPSEAELAERAAHNAVLEAKAAADKRAADDAMMAELEAEAAAKAAEAVEAEKQAARIEDEQSINEKGEHDVNKSKSTKRLRL